MVHEGVYGARGGVWCTEDGIQMVYGLRIALPGSRGHNIHKTAGPFAPSGAGRTPVTRDRSPGTCRIAPAARRRGMSER